MQDGRRYMCTGCHAALLAVEDGMMLCLAIDECRCRERKLGRQVAIVWREVPVEPFDHTYTVARCAYSRCPDRAT